MFLVGYSRFPSFQDDFENLCPVNVCMQFLQSWRFKNLWVFTVLSILMHLDAAHTEIYSMNKGICKGRWISHCMPRLSCGTSSHKCQTRGLRIARKLQEKMPYFYSVSLTLCCLSLLLRDSCTPCASWMNANVLIKPWSRSTLQPSLKICTKYHGTLHQKLMM